MMRTLIFGRRCKYHRCNSKIDVRIWILGIVEQRSNRMLLFHVDHRDEETLCTLIEKHVAPATTIFTDGWAGYQNLNARGFRHFSVVHKETFLQKYKMLIPTKWLKSTPTRSKHAKDHFRRIIGKKQISRHILPKFCGETTPEKTVYPDNGVVVLIA